MLIICNSKMLMHKICSICSIYFGGYNRIQFKEEETTYDNNFSGVQKGIFTNSFQII